jgi:hypothetical protein
LRVIDELKRLPGNKDKEKWETYLFLLARKAGRGDRGSRDEHDHMKKLKPCITSVKFDDGGEFFFYIPMAALCLGQLVMKVTKYRTDIALLPDFADISAADYASLFAKEKLAMTRANDEGP